MLDKKITFDSFIRMVLGMGIIVGVLMLIERLSGVLLPFFIAWLIAYLLYPLVKFFQYKLRLRNRAIAIICALLTLVLVAGGASYLLIPPAIEEFGRVQDLLTIYFADGIDSTNIPKVLSKFIHQNVDMEAINKMLSQENIAEATKNILPRLWTLLSDSIDFLFSILASLIILLYVVFILLDYESIAEGWIRLLPEKYRYFATALVQDVQKGMNNYFRGQALVALCVGILFCIGFLIIDFPLAIGLGVFIGVLNLVPYLKIIGFIPTIALAILKAADTGGNFWIILASAFAVFAIIQTIEDVIIVPKVMGKITGLNPAIILLSLSIWGSLMGILGMIIALPITTLLLSYYQRFIVGHERINQKVKESSDNQSTKSYEEK
nr:AI-2E family transporter [uncultured Bacteroides sp.]